MNSLDTQYQNLLQTILDYGVDKSDRTGTGTKSIFGYTIRHKMKEGFPLLTTKKMAVKTMMTELKWFLKGDTNIKYLVDNGCNIWNGDAYKTYERTYNWELEDPLYNQEEFIKEIKSNDDFARVWGDLGPIYGAQWRKWDGIDQIQNLINELKTNPDSRRLMVNAWNVGELDEMVLPPCHYGFQVYTRELSMEERIDYALSKNDFRFTDAIINEEDYEKYNIPTRAISLMWNQRSVDTFLGLPFNIASYGLLLEMIAKEVNMVPDELIGNLGDVHLYKTTSNRQKNKLVREPYKLPTIELSNVDILNGEFDYEIKDYKSHPTIKAPLSN
jgi:thymidylate synthase